MGLGHGCGGCGFACQKAPVSQKHFGRLAALFARTSDPTVDLLQQLACLDNSCVSTSLRSKASSTPVFVCFTKQGCGYTCVCLLHEVRLQTQGCEQSIAQYVWSRWWRWRCPKTAIGGAQPSRCPAPRPSWTLCSATQRNAPGTTMARWGVDSMPTASACACQIEGCCELKRRKM